MFASAIYCANNVTIWHSGLVFFIVRGYKAKKTPAMVTKQRDAGACNKTPPAILNVVSDIVYVDSKVHMLASNYIFNLPRAGHTQLSGPGCSTDHRLR